MDRPESPDQEIAKDPSIGLPRALDFAGFKQSSCIYLSMPIVLFVCVENTFRSVMAEAFFNAKAPKDWKAESAGVRAAPEINPVVVTLLREIGIEIGLRKPRLVTPEMIERAQRIITFGCLDQCPPRAKGKSEDWPLSGATGKTEAQLRAIRDDIVRHVDDLIRRIEEGSP